MVTSVGMPDNFNMIIAPVKKFLYINGFGGIQLKIQTNLKDKDGSITKI